MYSYIYSIYGSIDINQQTNICIYMRIFYICVSVYRTAILTMLSGNFFVDFSRSLTRCSAWEDYRSDLAAPKTAGIPLSDQLLYADTRYIAKEYIYKLNI